MGSKVVAVAVVTAALSVFAGAAQGTPPPAVGGNAPPNITITHTPLPAGIPLPPLPVAGQPGTVTVTFRWGGQSSHGFRWSGQSHGKPGSVTPYSDFASECSATIQTPFNYYGYAFSEEVTSCTADVIYIEDSMGLTRNGSVVATNGNYNNGSNETDDVLYGCVNNYHTWQALATIYADSSINGWSAGGVTSGTNYIYC